MGLYHKIVGVCDAQNIFYYTQGFVRFYNAAANDIKPEKFFFCKMAEFSGILQCCIEDLVGEMLGIFGICNLVKLDDLLLWEKFLECEGDVRSFDGGKYEKKMSILENLGKIREELAFHPAIKSYASPKFCNFN